MSAEESSAIDKMLMSEEIGFTDEGLMELAGNSLGVLHTACDAAQASVPPAVFKRKPPLEAASWWYPDQE